MGPTSRYRTITDLPAQIPLFPLRGVILLPRAELPLNLFEPRYLALLEDVIASHRIIGIIEPDATAEQVESPAGRQVGLKRIGCVGRVTAYQELNDGRMHITLTGIARFAVRSEPATAKPYRLADARYDAYAADLVADESAESVDRERLMRVLKVYLDNRRLKADWTSVARAPLEPLVNGLSAMSPFGPEEKQALLEAVDLEQRCEVLVALAEMAIAAGNSNPGTTLQ